MLNQTQMARVSFKVKGCLGELISTPANTPEEIAVIGKMFCEALNSMQDEVRFHAMKLPTTVETKEFFDSVNKIIFTDTAPEDDFIKSEGKWVCPRCENEEIGEEHQYCMICGLKLR